MAGGQAGSQDITASTLTHWKLVENVVAAVERSLSTVEGTSVSANVRVPERVSGTLRQVDVYVEIPTGARKLRVGIEVRARGSALDLPELEQLAAKLGKLDIDRGCIISRFGPTKEAMRAAAAAGIDLQTLAGIEHPLWWRASTVTVHRTEIEATAIQVNYPLELLPGVMQTLAGVSPALLTLQAPNEQPCSLHDLVLAEGLRAIRGAAVEDATYKDEFTLRLVLEGLSASCPAGPIPVPDSIDASYRLHRSIESVSLEAFAGPGGVTAFTGVSSGLDRQITFVAAEADDGSRRISVSVAQPRPPSQVIERRP